MKTLPDCPDCRRPMQEVTARARTGYQIILDQCGDCGGLWFDRWELFPLHAEEVARLDTWDADRLYAPVEADGPRDCPRCAIRLRDFRDANLPADAQVARCFVCEGMWLQRGQLRLVKRATARPARPPTAEDAEITTLVEAYAGQADWSRVRDLDNAMHEEEEPPPSLGDIGATVRSTLPWIALQILFRLLLKR